MIVLSLISSMALATYAFAATVPDNQVEVAFFMDKAVVDKYIESGQGSDEASAIALINSDVDYFISEINKIFQNLDGISLGVLKKAFIIMEENIFATEEVERHQGLMDFDEWRDAQGTYDKYKHDVAVLWTGRELVRSGNPATAGYANVGKICDSAKSSLIAEFDGTYKAVVVTAHELGHVLGSGHDSDDLRRVMGSEAAAVSTNRWFFSTDSAAAIQSVISGVTCLKETDPASENIEVDAPSDISNPDDICKRMEQNQESYMIKDKRYYEMIPPHGDPICRAIFCFNGNVDSADPAYASDGMLCGQNKRCFEGKCIESADADSGAVSETCVFGDQPELHLTGFTGDCAQLVGKFGKGICYYYDSLCCKTCEDLKSDEASCKYGNKSPKCAGKSQASVCGGSSATCCELCKGWNGKRSVDNDNAIILPTLEVPQQEKVNKNDGVQPTD